MYRIEVDTGLKVRSIITEDFASALRMFERTKHLAKMRGISCDVSLYSGYQLIETDTVNPTKVYKLN